MSRPGAPGSGRPRRLGRLFAVAPPADRVAKKPAKKAARKAAKQAARKAARQDAKAAKNAVMGAEKQIAPRQPKPREANPDRPVRHGVGRLPHDFDEAARTIIRTVAPRTMTSATKLYGLIGGVRHVVQHEVPGAIVECGVWRGGSMQAIALALLGAGVNDRDLYLYDTFEGMTEPTKADVRRRDGAAADELLATKQKSSAVWAIAGLDDVRAGMVETGYPADRMHFHAGPVEQTIPDAAPERIALLRLDTDWYASTAHELEHLYHRLSPGGVLILDDYGYWEGARKAVDEWLERTGEPLFLVRMGGGRIAIKTTG